MIRRSHFMPFGAQFQADGRVRFALWAPGARTVDLCLQAGNLEELIPMAAEEGGWFRLVTDRAGPGSLYRFRIDSGMKVPDPASRRNPADVHGPSEVVDPADFLWQDDAWTGRPWEETVIYELHVGSFTMEGTFRAAADKLDYLADLGVTAVELMPVADFPGTRNWGYDGVLPYAPDSSYGHPADLKYFIQAAHARGLMVFMDVVYNHFGPEGNYLHVYAPQFFTDRHHTPWGAAINFDGPESRPVRDFFIHNALYWLEEYHLDGLRLDAVHAILDDSRPDILEELAEAVRNGPGRDRSIHLVLENDSNQAHYLLRRHDGNPPWYTAQWNDDIHHALHVLLTGEADGYYGDYAARPLWYLGRCLTEGFAYQGEPSPYRDHRPRGEPSGGLPAGAFVGFLQTHDQVGNRAFGERIGVLAAPDALRAAAALVLLAPSPPLLFMGEEWAATSPFLFFCDFGPDLARAVSDGRRNEFSRFARFADEKVRATIPDPNGFETFARSRLDWRELEEEPHAGWHGLYRRLLDVRQRELAPRLAGMAGSASFEVLGSSVLLARWPHKNGSCLRLAAQMGSQAADCPPVAVASPIYATGGEVPSALERGQLPPWAVVWWWDGAESGEPR